MVMSGSIFLTPSLSTIYTYIYIYTYDIIILQYNNISIYLPIYLSIYLSDLSMYIYIYTSTLQWPANWRPFDQSRQWGAVLFIDDMNLEYDDVIPGSLECSEGHQTGAAHAAAACHGWIGDVVWLVWGIKQRFPTYFNVQAWYHRNTKNVENVFQCHSFEGVGLRPVFGAMPNTQMRPQTRNLGMIYGMA